MVTCMGVGLGVLTWTLRVGRDGPVFAGDLLRALPEDGGDLGTKAITGREMAEEPGARPNGGDAASDPGARRGVAAEVECRRVEERCLRCGECAPCLSMAKRAFASARRIRGTEPLPLQSLPLPLPLLATTCAARFDMVPPPR